MELKEINPNINLNNSTNQLQPKLPVQPQQYNNSYLNNRRNEKEKIIYMNCNNENEMEKAIKYGIDNENRDDNFDKNHLIIEIKIYRYDKEKNLLKCGKLYIIRLETDIEEDVNKSIRSKKGDNNVNNIFGNNGAFKF